MHGLDEWMTEVTEWVGDWEDVGGFAGGWIVVLGWWVGN